MANELTYQSVFTGQEMDERFTAVAQLQAALLEVETALSAKYVKPASGIPETDLDSAVQSALAKARSAVQDLSNYYTKTEIDALLSAVNSQEYVDVASLPTASASTLGKIYLVGPTNNQYDRYYTSYDGSAYSWVAAGSTEINLANYATKAEVSQLDQKVTDVSNYSANKNLDRTYDIESYQTTLYGNNGTFATASYVDTAVYKLKANHKYKLAFNYDYNSTGATVGIVGYVSGNTVASGDTYVPILTGGNLVEGYEQILEPTEDKYIFIRWKSDAQGYLFFPCVTLTDLDKEYNSVKDVLADSPYTNKNEVDVTTNYVQLVSTMEGYYGSFRTASYVKVAVHKLLKGKSYRFVYNYDYLSTSKNFAIIGVVSSPSSVSAGNTFRLVAGGNELVEGFEYRVIPSEDRYVFIRWRSDASGNNYFPCVKIYESENNVIPVKEIIGDLEDLHTEEKASIVDAINSSINNPLYGKILALDGDSICAGAGYAGGYGKIIAERNGMTLQNLAVGGATIAAETYAGETPRHWICRNIENLREDADYIILEGGVNDTAGGTMSNSFVSEFDDTTFVGACEAMCRDLLERFRGKKVGFIIVHQVWAFTNFRETDTKYKALVAVLKKWGVPYCDLNTRVPAFGLLDSSDPLVTTYTKDGDGWHPNEEGYKKYYCDKIEAWMKTF